MQKLLQKGDVIYRKVMFTSYIMYLRKKRCNQKSIAKKMRKVVFAKKSFQKKENNNS